MKVGTDGVLLGAWATIPPTSGRVLDVGTGTGLLALMLAQRTDETTLIDAIEIEPLAAQQAVENVRQSPWAHRISIEKQSFQTFISTTSHRYDLIVCNPPYFSKSLKSNSANRNLARHGDTSLSVAELLRGSQPLLTANGKLCIILPTEMSKLAAQQAAVAGLFVRRKTEVSSQVNQLPKRTLLELSTSVAVPQADELVIYERPPDGYTAAYRRLTADFYLFF